MSPRSSAKHRPDPVGPSGSGTHAIDVAERRRLTRAAVSQLVRIRWDEKLFEGQVRDIGIGGMFVTAVVQPPYGQEVLIEMGSPLGPLTLPSIVRWAESAGFGVQFTLLGARETKAISDMLQASERDLNAGD